jgi:uncharacterized protein YggE
MKYLATIGLATAGAVAIAGCAVANRPAAAAAATSASQSAVSDARTISTRAVGTVSAAPDTLTLALGIQTQASSARAALSANNAKAAAVLAVLKRDGVADKDVQTSLSIQPSYNATGSISGYEVDDNLVATVHTLATAGRLIDNAAAAAGNAVRIQQMTFSVADDSAARRRARADAVTNAKAQAGEIATAAGGKLGALRSVAEVPADPSYPVNFGYAPAAAADAKAPLPTQVQPGSQQLTVTVDVVYDIAP